MNFVKKQNYIKTLEKLAMMISFAIWIAILLSSSASSHCVTERDREGPGYCRQRLCPIFPAPAVYTGLENCSLCLHNSLWKIMSLL